MHFGVDKATIVSTPLGPVSMSNSTRHLSWGLICHVHSLEPDPSYKCVGLERPVTVVLASKDGYET